MIKKPITINLSTGLEARPVAQLVQVASQFNSEIYVEIGKKRVNAKSIMGMMTLGLDAGEEITLSANGDDENAAMESIEQYLSNQQSVGTEQSAEKGRFLRMWNIKGYRRKGRPIPAVSLSASKYLQI